MHLYLRLGRRGLVALAIPVALAAPRRSSADVITIDDGATPGTTEIPFTCSDGLDNELWLPSMGFVYRNVEAFDLIPGDTIAFDRPGPRDTIATPARGRNLPSATAMYPAPASWRQTTTRIELRSISALVSPI